MKTKEEILGKKLAEFDIPTLRRWAKAPENEEKKRMRLLSSGTEEKIYNGEKLTPDEIDFFLAGHRIAHLNSRPQTVGEFIKKYHWALPTANIDEGGIGSSTVFALASRLKKEGLTQEDWPLIGGKDYFPRLSKKKKKEMPFVLVKYMDGLVYSSYFGLVMDGLAKNPQGYGPANYRDLTLGEFLETLPAMTAYQYFRSPFVRVWNYLRTQGFNRTDGTFMKFSRHTHLMNKGMRRLKRHRNLTQKERRLVIQIAIREGWIH